MGGRTLHRLKRSATSRLLESWGSSVFRATRIPVREADLLGRVRSDRVSRVIDFFVDPDYGPVLVTEFIEGRSLADVLMTERMGVEEAVELGIEIATSVRELHRAHIVHRDLKPGNLILERQQEGRRRAVIVDLGVSRLVSYGDEGDHDDLTAMTETQVVLGTVAYMAPEQILKAREATEAADFVRRRRHPVSKRRRASGI